jgi:Dienelactone hydrolase family
MADALAGFDRSTLEHAGRTHDVYRAGSGPGVIVVHEMPGLHPGVADFGRVLIDAGYTVYLPSLFGRPGEPFSVPETVRSIVQVCVAREFRILADRTSPVVTWLRALAARGGFEAVEIDSSPGNPHGIPSRAHSVLTLDLVDAPGHPTLAARDRVIDFLGERLR